MPKASVTSADTSGAGAAHVWLARWRDDARPAQLAHPSGDQRQGLAGTAMSSTTAMVRPTTSAGGGVRHTGAGKRTSPSIRRVTRTG